jgi:stringent starvation protein B
VTQQKPGKPETFHHLYGRGKVLVHVDASKPGVLLPAPLIGNRNVTLTYGANLNIPILDMVVTTRGLSATLSFDLVPTPTFVPWSAVYAIANADGVGVLYEDEVPQGIPASAADMTLEEEQAALARKPAARPPLEESVPETDRVTPTERAAKPGKALLC